MTEARLVQNLNYDPYSGHGDEEVSQRVLGVICYLLEEFNCNH